MADESKMIKLELELTPLEFAVLSYVVPCDGSWGDPLKDFYEIEIDTNLDGKYEPYDADKHGDCYDGLKALNEKLRAFRRKIY